MLLVVDEDGAAILAYFKVAILVLGFWTVLQQDLNEYDEVVMMNHSPYSFT